MQLIVSNHDVSYKGNAYSIARTLLNDRIVKDRINDPELIKQFAKKLFGFRSIDISKNLNVKDFIEETLNQREQFVTNYNLPAKDFRTELGDKIIQASFTATQNCAITNNKSLTEHFESFRQALGDENFILAGREYFKALQACGVVDITEDVISIFTGGGLINKGISKVVKVTKLDNAAQTIIKNVKKISRLDKTVDLKVAKKFRKRVRKLKQLEECFEPVVNPDGTMSYYPPENKEQLFKRMDAQNQKSNNKKLNKPNKLASMTPDEERYLKSIYMTRDRHIRLKKILEATCLDSTHAEMEKDIIRLNKLAKSIGLDMEVEYIMMAKLSKTGGFDGLHSDYYFKSFKDVQIKGYEELPGGAWRAYVSIGGSEFRKKTFFPKGILPERIINIIKENFHKINLSNLQHNGINGYTKRIETDCGLKLKYILQEKTFKIISVMPIGISD